MCILSVLINEISFKLQFCIYYINCSKKKVKVHNNLMLVFFFFFNNMVFRSFAEGLGRIRVLAFSLSLLELGLQQGCFRVPL